MEVQTSFFLTIQTKAAYSVLMSPKSTNLSSKRQEPLKQGTLSFATVKRVGSSNAASKSKSLKPTKPAPAPKSRDSISTDNTSADDDFDDVESPSEGEDEDEDEIRDSPDVTGDHTSTRTRAQTNKLTTVKKSAQEQKVVASATGTTLLKDSKARPDDISKTVLGISADEKPELDINDRKWNKHYAGVRKKMGYLPPGELIG